MYRIDLLKGKGVPARRNTALFALSTTAAGIVVMVALVAISSYIYGGVMERKCRQQLAAMKTPDSELEQARLFIANANQEKELANAYFREISNAVKAHRQWSSLMDSVVNALPESVMINKINLDRKMKKEKKNVEGEKPIDIICYQPILTLTAIPGEGYQGSESIKTFVQNLRQAQDIAPILEEIKVLSNYANDRSSNDKQVNYQIECVFRENKIECAQ